MGQQFTFWLGAGVVTAGVSGAMFAGAGVAGADTDSASDSSAASSSESAQSNGSKADSGPSGFGAKQRRGAQADSSSNSGGTASESAEPSESKGNSGTKRFVKNRSASRPESGQTTRPVSRKPANPDAVGASRADDPVEDDPGPSGRAAVRQRSERDGPDGDGPIRRDRRRRLSGPADTYRTGQRGGVGTGRGPRRCRRRRNHGFRRQHQCDASDYGASRRGGQGLGRRSAAAVDNQPGRVRPVQPPRGCDETRRRAPVLPPGSTVTVRSSTLEIGNGQVVPANWYYPATDEPPTRLIYLQHGFLATGPMYSYTAAYLSEGTNSSSSRPRCRRTRSRATPSGLEGMECIAPSPICSWATARR